MDSDLSSGQSYPVFEQPGPGLDSIDNNIYLHWKFLPTDSEEKMMPLSHIMQFRDIYTSVTSHLCKCLDMDQQVVTLLSEYALYSRFLPSFQDMNPPLCTGEKVIHFHRPSCMNWFQIR